MVAVGRADRVIHLLRPPGQEAEGARDDAADVHSAGVVLAADEDVEDVVYASYAMRRFHGLDLMIEQVPDVTTFLFYRNLLEKHELGRKLIWNSPSRLDVRRVVERVFAVDQNFNRNIGWTAEIDVSSDRTSDIPGPERHGPGGGRGAGD